MLSTTHAIFCGLQEHLCSILRDLPDSIDMSIKQGLLSAHEKLSDYYYKYDESPFYTWAAHKSLSLCLSIYYTDHKPVLDPRISYDGMKEDYEDDSSLGEYLETAKTDLHDYYQTHYTCVSQGLESHPSQTSVVDAQGSPQKVNFTSRYRQKDRVATDELEEYFKLAREDFESCDPLHWWVDRRAQFPNLFWLARDIFSIPG